MLSDRRKSRCYMKVEERTGRRRCSQEIGESVTKATCCCTIGKAWGPQCELCPPEGSEEYKFLCPNNNGYRPNSITVSILYIRKFVDILSILILQSWYQDCQILIMVHMALKSFCWKFKWVKILHGEMNHHIIRKSGKIETSYI